MTEAEWLGCIDPNLMLNHLYPNLSDRKRLLYACACCFRVWDLLKDPRSRHAVEVAFRHADSQVTEEERESAEAEAEAAWKEELELMLDPEQLEGDYCPPTYTMVGLNAVVPMDAWGGAPAYEPPDWTILQLAPDRQTQGRAQADLLRDISGNPFRPVTFNTNWRTSDVVAIARGMYETRDFAAMPILADALQDPGCENADILPHCRGDGQHVRGCWVVDLILEKD